MRRLRARPFLHFLDLATTRLFGTRCFAFAFVQAPIRHLGLELDRSDSLQQEAGLPSKQVTLLSLACNAANQAAAQAERDDEMKGKVEPPPCDFPHRCNYSPKNGTWAFVCGKACGRNLEIDAHDHAGPCRCYLHFGNRHGDDPEEDIEQNEIRRIIGDG